MDGISVKNLISVLQGFSNEMTKQVIAKKLDISYSTLNRANKSGKWPRSIASESMRALFDESRNRFFKGDECDLVTSVLLQLQAQGMETGRLELVLEHDGYDGFLLELITQAKHHDSKAANTNEDIVVSDTMIDDGVSNGKLQPQVEGAESVHIPRRMDIVMALPIAVILLMGVFNISLSTLFAWAAKRQLAFWLISLCIAVAPTIAGVFVDSPLAWRAYKRSHPEARFTTEAFARVAKYGDVEGVAPGAGRYDLTKLYLMSQPTCNILGALCYLSLFQLLIGIGSSRFYTFFIGHEWTEFFKVGIVIAFFTAFGHMRDQMRNVSQEFNRDNNGLQGGYANQNPDNYRLSRAHVWMNAFHLVWTISLLVILTFALIAFSIAMFRTIAMPTLAVWPFMHCILFFVFACASSTARKMHASCVGTLVPGVLALSVGTAVLTLACYLPSWGSVLLCVTCSTCVAWVLVWWRRQKNLDWVIRWKTSGAYSIAIATVIAILVLLGLVTSAFA